MLRNKTPLGLAAVVLALLAGVKAHGQALGPPGNPPSEQRGLAKGEPIAVPDLGVPMCCQPFVETRDINRRKYTDVCYKVCYPSCKGMWFGKKCGCDGCDGGCDGGCADGTCHQCSKVYTKKYLVLHIRKEQECVNYCKPVPTGCEAPCPAPCGGVPVQVETLPALVGVPGSYRAPAPVMQGVPVMRPAIR